MKILRELRDYGEDLGLKYVGVEDGSKHVRIVFRNDESFEYPLALHRTKNEVFRIKVNSLKSNLKKFAEHRYETLPIRRA